MHNIFYSSLFFFYHFLFHVIQFHVTVYSIKHPALRHPWIGFWVSESLNQGAQFLFVRAHVHFSGHSSNILKQSE